MSPPRVVLLRGGAYAVATPARMGWTWQTRQAVPTRCGEGPAVGGLIRSGWRPLRCLALRKAEAVARACRQ